MQEHQSKPERTLTALPPTKLKPGCQRSLKLLLQVVLTLLDQQYGRLDGFKKVELSERNESAGPLTYLTLINPFPFALAEATGSVAAANKAGSAARGTPPPPPGPAS